MLADAVLVVDKPSGPTSFEVVRRIRRASGVRRVGHGGTLDPLASGVLPVCLGEATKLTQFFLGADKEYEVTVRFGVETDTDDAQGTPTVTRDARAVDEAAIRSALGPLRGSIEQVPPAYAAIKRDGKPLYAYARAGQSVKVAPRRVIVHVLELAGFDGPDRVRLEVRCSKGTYVRALARDLGRALGVGGHVAGLRRTASGPFRLLDATPLDAVLAALAAGDPERLPLLSPAAALRHLPQRTVGPAAARDLRDGKRVLWAGLAGDAVVAEPPICLVDEAGELVAVAEPRPDGTVQTLRVFGNARFDDGSTLTARG